MPSGAQIIDEASQVELATGALALSCTKKDRHRRRPKAARKNGWKRRCEEYEKT